MLKVPYQQTWTREEDICLSFKMIKPDGEVNQLTLTKGGTLGEMQKLFKSDLDEHDIVADAGDFIVMQSFDKKEIRILDFFSGMMHPLKIRLVHDQRHLKLNFALSRVQDSLEKYRLLVCTYDAQWRNQCLVHQISVLPIQEKIQIGSA